MKRRPNARALLSIALLLGTLFFSWSASAQDLRQDTRKIRMIAPEAFSGLSRESEESLDKVFQNNTCAAAFLPDDVAKNVMQAALGQESAGRMAEDLSNRGYAWNKNARTQNYVPAYAMIAQMMHASVPANYKLKDVLKNLDLDDVNASLLERKEDFVKYVEKIADAGFRFQVDKKQEAQKLGFLGFHLDTDKDQLDALATQLKYATKDAQGQTAYHDSAFFAAYLIEAVKLTAAGSARTR